VEDIFVPAGASETFMVDVTTKLSNPVGPRSFEVTATGGNSTASVNLTAVIDERWMAPVIEVEYDFFGNVSVPMRFDASGSWDHNGDEIGFTWDFGDGGIGTGAVVEHTYSEEGEYIVLLNVSDGTLHSLKVLEVLVQDAIPPVPDLRIDAVDVDAVLLSWTPWNNSQYLHEYRVYYSNNPQFEVLAIEESLVWSSDLSYLGNAIVPLNITGFLSYDDPIIGYLLFETENIYGASVYSRVTPFNVTVNFREYPEDDSRYHYVLHISNLTSTSVDILWRTWKPLGTGFMYTAEVDYWYGDGYGGSSHAYEIRDLAGDQAHFYNLSPGNQHRARIWYVWGEDDPDDLWKSFSFLAAEVWFTPPIQETIQIQTAPYDNATVDEEYVLHVRVSRTGTGTPWFYVNWGDGSPWENAMIWMDPNGDETSFSHNYTSVGAYNITVHVSRDIVWNMSLIHPGLEGTIITIVTVTEDDGEPQDDDGTNWDLWDYIIAIAVILFVAFLGYLAGHATGYFKMGKKGEPFWGDGEEEGPEVPAEEPEPEGEPEPEPTAEEIVSELETKAGDEDEVE
jgi:hypothetical protein